MNRRPLRPSGRVHGFTLIEILVVVVIIGLLLAIGLAVGPQVIGKGDQLRTEQLLSNLETLYATYLEETGQSQRNLATTEGEFNYVVDDIDELITNASRMDTLGRAGVASLKDAVKHVDTNDDGAPDEYRVLDAWDNQIFFKYTDEPHDDEDDFNNQYTTGNPSLGFPETAETGEPPFDEDFANPRSNEPENARTWYPNLPDIGETYFASPGPDARFGDFTMDRSNSKYQWSRDNIYSKDAVYEYQDSYHENN